MPLPMTTTSAVAGRFLVDLWPMRSGEGSVCQKESVDLGVGSEAGCPSLGRSGMVRAMMVAIGLVLLRCLCVKVSLKSCITGRCIS